MIHLTAGEFADLKSQIVTSSWGGLRRATPYAFTEQGVAMLASVLRSRRAVRVNVEIMRVHRGPGVSAYLSTIWTTLRRQQAEAVTLEAAIAANLKELGYGG